MYCLTTLLVAVLSGLHVHADTPSTLAWDGHYGDGRLSLDGVACSNGANGIETRYPEYTTLGSLPNFPNVTAVYTVEKWNSQQCGTCYAVTYGKNTVKLLAVDIDDSGFTTSQEAMDFLTDGQAAAFGRVDVTFVEVPASECGLN